MIPFSFDNPAFNTSNSPELNYSLKWEEGKRWQLVYGVGGGGKVAKRG